MTKSLEHEIKVKVTRSMWVQSRDIEEKPYASLMVVGFIIDEILRVGLKNDKVTGA